MTKIQLKGFYFTKNLKENALQEFLKVNLLFSLIKGLFDLKFFYTGKIKFPKIDLSVYRANVRGRGQNKIQDIFSSFVIRKKPHNESRKYIEECRAKGLDFTRDT